MKVPLGAAIFFRERECWRLSWKGLVFLFFVTACLTMFAGRGVYPLLARNDPLPGGSLVVEGWAGDAAMLQAIHEMKTGRYARLFVTGTPIPAGEPLSDFQTLAEFGASSIRALSDGTVEPCAVPAVDVKRDRTFASALALRSWMLAHGGIDRRITVLSVGPHTRRTGLLFQKAFESEAQIGVIATAPASYDPARWWNSAEGFRAVFAESIAYLYARLLFHPQG